MIKRVVKMVFREDSIPTFLDLFHEIKSFIRNFKGCTHLELWKDKTGEVTFFTYSYWESEEALEQYRNSDFFKVIWPKTKALFAEKAQAWSINVVDESKINPIEYADVNCRLQEFIREHDYSEIAILCDENTRHFCLPFIAGALGDRPYHIIEIRSGERSKNIDIVQEIWRAMFNYGLNRKSLLINLGGGVVGDMGGFSAATYMRGIDFLNVPTTLLSMIDASVGGKTGIDMDGIKNGVGVFSDPKLVIVDPIFLKTLPARHIKSGLAEAVKHGIINSEELYHTAIDALKKYSLIDEKWIRRIIQVKWDIVNLDPGERDMRRVLNLGHTIGHALESHFLESEQELLHGEAIALGLIFENEIAVRYGLMPPEVAYQIKEDLLRFYEFPGISIEDVDKIIKWIVLDKKNSKDKINFVLTQDFGIIERNFEMKVPEFREVFTQIITKFIISF